MARKTPTQPEPEMPLRLAWMTPDELEDNPGNWRRHPTEQVSALNAAMETVGWAGAALYNASTGRLVDGHCRKKIRPELLVDGKMPVLIGNWTEEQERMILLTLDPLAGMAEADSAALESLIKDVRIADEALAAMVEGLAEDAGLVLPPEDAMPADAEPQVDRAAELQAKWGTAAGQLWLLGGKHRLLCGDSTKPENVARVMGGEKAELCFTSPPYGQQRDYTTEGKEKCADWDGLMRGVFGNLPMTDAGQVLVNLGLIHREGEWIPYWDGWIEWMRGQGWRRFGWYVWDKLAGMPGDWCGRFAPSFEFIWHFNREAVRPIKWVECKDAGRVVQGRTRGKDGNLRIHTASKNGDAVQSHKIPDDVIRCVPAKGIDNQHPAVFPLSLADSFVKSWPGSVYDPFLGSGTTLIAAENLGRRCYGIEISPAYTAVVLERFKTAFPDQEIRLVE